MMSKWMMLVMMGALVTLSGCNTLQGVGKDLEKAGEAVQKSAK